MQEVSSEMSATQRVAGRSGSSRRSMNVGVAALAMIMTVLAFSTSPAFARKHHTHAVIKPSATPSPTGGPQASITLNNGNVVLTNHNDFSWDILKDGSYTPAEVTTPAPGAPLQTGGQVNWTITDTKTGPVHTLIVNGYMSVTNTGSANATIGNIVVNLQH